MAWRHSAATGAHGGASTPAAVALTLAVSAGKSHGQFPSSFRDGEMGRLHHHGELLDLLDPRLVEELLRPGCNRAERARRDPVRLNSNPLHKDADLQLDLLRRPARRRRRARP